MSFLIFVFPILNNCSKGNKIKVFFRGTVNVYTESNHYSKDVSLLTDIPVVATSKSRVVFERNGKSDEVENEMMEARWKVFEFTHQIPHDEQKEVEPCGKCFSENVLLGEI